MPQTMCCGNCVTFWALLDEFYVVRGRFKWIPKNHHKTHKIHTFPATKEWTHTLTKWRGLGSGCGWVLHHVHHFARIENAPNWRWMTAKNTHTDIHTEYDKNEKMCDQTMAEQEIARAFSNRVRCGCAMVARDAASFRNIFSVAVHTKDAWNCFSREQVNCFEQEDGDGFYLAPYCAVDYRIWMLRLAIAEQVSVRACK